MSNLLTNNGACSTAQALPQIGSLGVAQELEGAGQLGRGQRMGSHREPHNTPLELAQAQGIG